MKNSIARSTLIALAAVLVAAGCTDESKTVAQVDGGSDGDTDGDADGDSDSDSDSDTGVDDDPFEDCTSVTEGASNTCQPADIVFPIDNSPSLEDEIAAVRANMNEFSQTIFDAGIDPQIVLISCIPGDCGNSGGGDNEFYGICIEPPFGAEDGCEGDSLDGPVSDDTNLPHYLHLSTRVPSVKGLQWILETYEDDNPHTDLGWHGMMRPGATKHFVVISDDTDETAAADFDAALTALDPMLEGYFFHGIFSYLSKEDACAISDSEPCCEFAAPGGEGAPYKELVSMTDGVSGDLCEQDFAPVFEAIAGAVVGSSEISCEWEIPEPPPGETLDPDKVNVEFIYDGGESYFVGYVEGPEQCDEVSHGWYYDDPEDPTMIYVCPQTCEWFQSVEDAGLVIHFGCETESAIE